MTQGSASCITYHSDTSYRLYDCDTATVWRQLFHVWRPEFSSYEVTLFNENWWKCLRKSGPRGEGAGCPHEEEDADDHNLISGWLLMQIEIFGVYDAVYNAVYDRDTSYRLYDARIWPAVWRMTQGSGQVYDVWRKHLSGVWRSYAYDVSRLTPCYFSKDNIR